MRVIMASLAMASISCAATSEPADTPSGSPGFKVTCVKTEDAGYCVEEATKRCGPGYRVESSEEFTQFYGPGHGMDKMLRWIISCP